MPWLDHRQDYANFTPSQGAALAEARYRIAQALFLWVPDVLFLPCRRAHALDVADLCVEAVSIAARKDGL